MSYNITNLERHANHKLCSKGPIKEFRSLANKAKFSSLLQSAITQMANKQSLVTVIFISRNNLFSGAKHMENEKDIGKVNLV
jgi:hypothetical protein